MKAQRAWRQATVLALVATLGVAVGAVTLVSASAEHNDVHDGTDAALIDFPHLPAETSAEEQSPDDVDIVIVYDQSGSMEYDTLCYGCWEPSEEPYPNGRIYPLHWSDSSVESADHCATTNRYHDRGGEYYIVIEAEEYSRLNEALAPGGIPPYYTFWVLQRNAYNAYYSQQVGAKGRDDRGAYLSHHPYANFQTTSGLGVACTWYDLTHGEYCRSGLPTSGPFPAPRADYDFYAPRNDTYYFHIRGQGGNYAGDRHIFWGVDGAVLGQESGFDGGAYYDGARSDRWSWRRLSKGEGGNQGDTVWLEAGNHTLHLWAGGAGFDVDRMIISTDGSLDTTERNLSPNDGRTNWACLPCDPRFAGRPGGALVCDPDDPSSCIYRPDCSVGGSPDQRKHPIYDDEQPMRKAVEAAKRFVGRLNPRFAQVGYVRYSTNARIASELQCLRRLGADNCTAQVITDTVLYELDRTRAGGSTNIAGGIESGIDVLSTVSPHYGRPGAARVMVLMTDGQANRYPNDECWQEDLWPDVGDPTLDRANDCVMYYAQQARDNGIAICTITLGASADRELMTEVAELTGCIQRGADSREELDAVFYQLYERIFLQLTAQKTPSEETAMHGQAVTYTIAIQSPTGPLTATVHLTDEVPIGLSYVPGTLTATVGTVTDDDAPTLRWSGVLSPTPTVIVRYGVTVSASAPQVVTNTAVIAAAGYQAISRTATVTVVQAPGQPDLTPSYKAVSPQYANHGERVTYTIAIQSLTGPLTATVHLTDEVPIGLSYVPGTLTATVGTVTADDAPTLHWSGVLSPTPAVTVTYGITVSATVPQVISNTAAIAAAGYQAISRTATVTVVQTPGQPDLTPSYKAVSPQYAIHGERVTYTIAIHNATSPLSYTIPPSPKGCQQLLQAGGFEGDPQTVFSYWHVGEPLAYKHQSRYFYDGIMSMRLHASMGSFPECLAYHPYLWQAVTIPEEVHTTTTMVVQGQQLVAGSLAPCSIPGSAEADDVLYLQMQDSSGGDLGDAAEIVDGGVVTQTWEAFEVDVTDAVDLTNHAGQEVRVHFTATHDEDFADTWFYLDALECEVCTEWLIGLTDTVPDGLSYVSGTLTATAGTVTDVAAPTLRWSGVLSPTRNVTVTYAVTVSAIAPRVITNTAVITVPGYQPISRTARLWANPYPVFLPVVMRNGPGSARGTTELGKTRTSSGVQTFLRRRTL